VFNTINLYQLNGHNGFHTRSVAPGYLSRGLWCPCRGTAVVLVATPAVPDICYCSNDCMPALFSADISAKVREKMVSNLFQATLVKPAPCRPVT
jgi:hypothetical protein